MEAEADLVNYGAKNALETEFLKLADDQDIEKQLAELKAKSVYRHSSELTRPALRNRS